MFESLELDHKLDKATFDAEEPKLRGALLDAQFDLLEKAESPVIVLLSGTDILGRAAAMKRLYGWLDSRHLRGFALKAPSDEESQRPPMWRFWRALPPKGRIGVFLGSWYEHPAAAYFLGRISHADYQVHIQEVCRFEQMLANEGALLLKFIFFLPKKDQIKHAKRLAEDPTVAWKLGDEEREIVKHVAKRYEDAMEILHELVQATSTGHAPWIGLPSRDPRYRDFTLGTTLAEAIRERLAHPAKQVVTAAPRRKTKIEEPTILNTLDLSQALERDDYRSRLRKAQSRLSQLTLKKKFEKRALVAVFEGNDAAGKGGSVRRVIQALDPRMLRVIPIAAPSDEEKAQPYLWRFWRHVPGRGEVAIFDRSWYGRVLVERIEGFAPRDDWMRAYSEIRDFEAELCDHGIIVQKFWLAIDKKEQLRRFKEREKVGFKRYKITEEDWRNRKKWDAYADAVCDMIDRTSTPAAPWTVVEANDKYFARIKVLETLTKRLKAEL